MLLVLIAAVLIVTIFMFAQKLAFKKGLETRLGRKVPDRELTSTSAWMEDSPPSEKIESGQSREEEWDKTKSC